MAFSAAYTTHAIDEVVFRAHLRFPLSNEMLQAIQAKHLALADLPVVEITPNIEFNMAPDGRGGMISTPREAGLSGVSFSSMKPDASPAWQVRALANTVEIKCRDYARWAAIWPRSLRYFHTIFGDALSGEVQLRGVSLQYIDLFNWTGPEQAYDLEPLLRKGAELLLDSIFKRGSLWHLYQGWFEDREMPAAFGGPSKLLNRLNLAGRLQDGVIQVVIDQVSQINFTEDCQCASFFSGSHSLGQASSVADQTFDGLHQLNKITMLSILKPEVTEAIGLRKTEGNSSLARRIVG